MKNIIIPFLLFATALFVWYLKKEDKKCCKKDSSGQKLLHCAEKKCCKKDTTQKLLPVSGESIYNLASEWENQNGEKILLSHFSDKIVVAAMVFTHCASACPRITADMKQIEALLSETERQQVLFLLLSMDPNRDTPQRMNTFIAQFQLNKDWTLLRSSEDATMELANALGVRVKPLSDGGFDHSNAIHVLNQKGEIVYQQVGLDINPRNTIQAIRALIQ